MNKAMNRSMSKVIMESSEAEAKQNPHAKSTLQNLVNEVKAL